jgi:acetylglutamate kinase
VHEAIRKADVLIAALGWIRRFRGKYVVAKLGGSSVDDASALDSFLTDLIFMETVGMKPILVHGGGKAINKAMDAAGIVPRFVKGRRYTDEKTLGIATGVLAEEICPALVSRIGNLGGQAEALSYATTNCLVGEKLTLKDESGEPLDLGAVGHVVSLDESRIRDVCAAEKIPVIPSVALTRDAKKLNVNADTAAAAVARILRVEKLVFLSDVAGIFRDRNDPESRIPHVTAHECRRLIADGTIDSGMVPKVEAALEALAAGVGKVHIVDARHATFHAARGLLEHGRRDRNCFVNFAGAREPARIEQCRQSFWKA